MGKTAMEIAFRELMKHERDKNISKWPEDDVRRNITVVLWDIKEQRKVRFEEKRMKEATCNGY